MSTHLLTKWNVRKKCRKCGVWLFLADGDGSTKSGQFAKNLILAMVEGGGVALQQGGLLILILVMLHEKHAVKRRIWLKVRVCSRVQENNGNPIFQHICEA
jgi:hypothetical protein